MTGLIIELSQSDTALDQLLDNETCLVVSTRALDGAMPDVVEYLFPAGVAGAIIAHVADIIRNNIIAKRYQRIRIDGEILDFTGYTAQEIGDILSDLNGKRDKPEN